MRQVSETERSDRKTAGVAEWQTHQTQNLTGATSCRFKSGRRHYIEKSIQKEL